MSDSTRARPYTRQRIAQQIGVPLALLLIVVGGVFNVLMLRESGQADARLEHTLQVMLTLIKARGLVEDAGRYRHVYRLFGDSRSLDTYRDIQQELPTVLQQLRDTITADDNLSARLERVATLIDQDNAEPTMPVVPPQVGAGAKPLPPDLAAGLNHTDAITAVLDDMLQDEQNLLRDRIASVHSHEADRFVLAGLRTLAALVLVGVIFLLMRRDTRQSEQLIETQSGELQESQQRFRRIFEESPFGMVLSRSDDRRIVDANPAFCEMTGYNAAELVGRSGIDIAHGDDSHLLRDIGPEAPDSGQFIEKRYVSRSGAAIWARVRRVLMGASGDHPTLVLALVEDITQQKRVEAELRQAQRMEAVGQLTGGIAHDFNNLLGVIIGNVEFLLDAVADNPEQTGLVNEILSSALGGADLTRRLLAFARRQTLQPRRIDLNGHLSHQIVMLRRLLGETIRIETTLAADLWPTRADPSQVADTLLNLAINARDAMPYGGSIAIETANAHLDEKYAERNAEVTAGDYVVLSVTDTGVGMPREVVERALEPFFTTKEPGAGSGLGLSMIYGFARQSGGHLKIYSEVGRGTTVRLYLPRAPVAENAPLAEVGDTSLRIGNETILLVDDDAEMRAVARRHLASLGYRVREADNGPAALAILQDGARFDLLFTDVVMPGGMTGYQLAAAAAYRQPGLKVLFTTGYARTGSRNDLAEPVAMLRKPYRKRDLAAAIRTVLDM